MAQKLFSLLIPRGYDTICIHSPVNDVDVNVIPHYQQQTKNVYMEGALQYHHKLPITIHKLKYLAMVDKQLSTYLFI